MNIEQFTQVVISFTIMLSVMIAFATVAIVSYHKEKPTQQSCPDVEQVKYFRATVKRLFNEMTSKGIAREIIVSDILEFLDMQKHEFIDHAKHAILMYDTRQLLAEKAVV